MINLLRILGNGLLGINARNLLYIRPFNPRKAVAFADDKLQTKMFLAARGIPTAKIYARIATRGQLRQFDFSSLPSDCVLKPNSGYGGEGILLLHRNDGSFSSKGRGILTERDLTRHIEDIFEGRYSIGGRRDTAFFEQLLTAHPCFAPFRPDGLPDIRVIVFNLVPIMAMLRIPTSVSSGKANLHLGGIGIGIDLAKGVTTHAAQYHHTIDRLPHGTDPAGITIPFWDDILLLCSRIQYMTNIGYLACDITITREMGPALLEVNARAGLSVQVANLAPLQSRLERVKGIRVRFPEKGVRIGQDLFGEKLQEKAGIVRPVLGLMETVHIAGAGIEFAVPAVIDPRQERTTCEQSLLSELLEKGAVEPETEKSGAYRIKFTLGGRKVQTLIAEGQVTAPGRLLIGKRDLTGFLLDPGRQASSPLPRRRSGMDRRAADRLLARIDDDLSSLRWLKPENLLGELEHLRSDRSYHPHFLYPPFDSPLEEAESRLSLRVTDHSPLGVLLEKKRLELLRRIVLLRARGDAVRFTRASEELFGAPTSALIRTAEAALAGMRADGVNTEKPIALADAVTLLRAALDRYSLRDWEVVVRPKMVSDCAAGKNTVFLREGASFTRTRMEALIAHEIETHVLTVENGRHQPFLLLQRGCAAYLETQEGLAVYNQNRVLLPGHEKRFGPARSVVGIAFGLTHSFAETRTYLEEVLRYSPEKALTKAIDIKRGLSDTSLPGGFTKGLVYLRGQQMIEQFVSGGGDLRRLYIGKVSLDDLDLIEQIPGLLPPLLLPAYLQEKSRKGGE
ncbi:MAG: tyrosine/phenylalanine carboxypeptidase domain-containing protein [Candidatus Peregrinibacteria bacterium]